MGGEGFKESLPRFNRKGMNALRIPLRNLTRYQIALPRRVRTVAEITYGQG